MKKAYFFILILILTNNSINAQLAGYYTVGGGGADYPELQDALSDLYLLGISEHVTFALNPGIYTGFNLTEISGSSEESRFTIESSTLDSADVTISGTIIFTNTSYITVNALSIRTGYARPIHFEESWDIIITQCNISSVFDDWQGGIYLDHHWEDEESKITIEYCRISGESPCIYARGNNGYTDINYCVINSVGEPAIKADCKKTNLIYDTIHGGVDIEAGIGLIVYKGNWIEGSVEMGYIDTLIDNTIIDEDDVIRISARYYINNYISGLQLQAAPIGSHANKTLIGNYIDAPISFRQDRMYMIDNEFHGYTHLSFTEVLLMEGNKVYDDFNYGDLSSNNWNYRIKNNIFFSGFIRCTGHNSEITYNTFIDSAELYIDFSNIKVHDNLFCRPIRGATNTENCYNNNYYPLIYCFYDTLSMHYDPMFDPDKPGIATNPMLQGKGMSEAPEFDILGNPRKNPPAIGANEICVSSDSMNNVVNILCGDEVYLNLCNTPDTGSFWWEPDSLFNWPDSSYAMLTAYQSTTAYLHNSVYGILDSVLINVEPFEVEIAPMPLFYCGYARTLNASYHPFASYSWWPHDGLSDPYIRTPKLLVEDTTTLQYILTCEVPGCGTSYDTLNVEFDPSPHVGVYYPSQNLDTVFFSCLSTCVDEYFWEFGDGKTSTEENPYHIYEEEGYYEIKLTGTNYYGSDSTIVGYYYYVINTGENQAEPDIKLFPNPANDRVFISGLPIGFNYTINIIDMQGNLLLHAETTDSDYHINTESLPAGVYVVNIRSGGQSISKKLVISR